MSHVFVTGATGYLGRPLVERLVDRGHRVVALARPESASRLPAGCEPCLGDALDAASYAARVARADTLVHLVGVAHPSPAKAEAFLRIDLASTVAAIAAAQQAGVRHFVYLSVAQPAPAMRAYVAARAEGERRIRESGLAATFLRPWYVLGPGHRWPVLLLPLYALAAALPGSRDTARRLGLVTRPQMLAALVDAVERPAEVARVVEVPEIRRGAAMGAGGVRAPVLCRMPRRLVMAPTNVLAPPVELPEADKLPYGLDAAPRDDEPETPEERAAVVEALREIHEGTPGLSSDDLRRELGLR